MSLSPALADPLKQTLAAEGQPLLDEFTSLISSAVSGLLAKSPALGVGAELLLQVGHIFAQAELNNLLAHNAHVQGSSTVPLPPLATAAEAPTPPAAPVPDLGVPGVPAPEPPPEPGGQPQHVPPPEPPPPPAPGEPGGQPRPDPLEQPSTGPFGLTS